MKFVSNAGTDRVVDLVRPWLKPEHQLDAVSPAYSLFAFAEFLADLPNLSHARLVLPPLVSQNADFNVHEQLGLLGAKADRTARNKLQGPWLARKFASWVDAKTQVRHARGAIPQGTLVLRDDQGAAQQAVLGSFAFSSEGLGITPGNPLSLIQTSENPAEARTLSQWFDMQWAALNDQPDAKAALVAAIKALAAQRDLLPPTLESSRRPDQFVATFLFHHFLGPDDLEWLRRLTGETISDEEARALVFVRELGAIDNAAYRSINRTDTLNASSHLRRLRDLDLLDMKGSGSRTYYVPGAGFSIPLIDTHQPAEDSHQGGDNSHQPIKDSHQLLATVPAALKARIPEAGSKPRREVMRVLIEDLCRWHALSARELAAILNGREHKPLVRDYLSPMVAEGVLAYTIPEMEYHPEQRYTVPVTPKKD
jgi:hypothetical protein